MKKSINFVFLLLAITTIAIISACGKSTADTNPSIDMASVCNEIMENNVFNDSLSQIDISYSDMTIGINPDSFQSAVIYTGSGATAEELCIIQVNAEKDSEYIVSKLNTHISNQAKAYSGYKPEEVDKINSAIIKSKGCYTILCVAENITTAEEIIDKYFK